MATKHKIRPRWEVDAALARSDEVPLEVKAVPIWRSSDGALLGYYPAIFGPNRWANYTCLLPAFPTIDVGDINSKALYSTPEEALHVWANSPATEIDNAHKYNMAITDSTAARINKAGLFRNPLLAKTVENPFETEGIEAIANY